MMNLTNKTETTVDRTTFTFGAEFLRLGVATGTDKTLDNLVEHVAPVHRQRA